MARLSFIFPGQGAQTVGMGKAIYEASEAARAIYQAADDILGLRISSLCFHGPADVLQQTERSQLAMLITGVATLAALKERLKGTAVEEETRPICFAGHSLGEYTALVAAGALSLTDALQLVRLRGELMAECGRRVRGGMAAVLDMDESALEPICAEARSFAPPGRGVWIANYNHPGQLVLSGSEQELRLACEIARERGARRVKNLAVSAAFHSPLMAAAQEPFAEAVGRTSFMRPSAPLIANVTGSSIQTVDAIRRELVDQVASPVQWIRCVQAARGLGVDTCVEFGPSKVLGGLISRIDARMATAAISDPPSLATFLASLEQ